MSRSRRALLATAIATAVLAAPAVRAQETPTPSPVAGGSSAGGDTAAVAINTKDGFDVFRLAFAIKRSMGDVVDNTNAAVAFASCTDCQTVAVSIQVVLMMNDPSVVTPTNLAIAINQECTLCETLAAAYQVILTTEAKTRFTSEGRREIAAIRHELLEIRKAGLSIEEIVARLDTLMDRFYRVLDEELVPKDGSDSPSETPSPSPTSTETPEASPSQGSASATESPTSSPSTLTPSATASPTP
jgi:putative peptide zinc metalloprotease protein